MKKLHEAMGVPLKKGLLGVEIECEGANLQIPSEQFWNTEADGSLRGRFPSESAEYVLKGPQSVEFTKKALIHLNEIQKDAQLKFSFRTSVHVHCNMQDATEDQILNTMYTYFLIENTLLRYCGDVRIGNRFCLRLGDAEELLVYIKHFIIHGFDGLRQIDENRVRYAALNMASLRKYGSLEFRGMRGTMDPEVLFPWIDAIANLKKYAMSKKDIVEIHKEFREHGVNFIWRVLGEDAERFMDSNIRHDIAECFSISYEVVVAYQQEKKRRESVKKKEQAATKNTPVDWDAMVRLAQDGAVEQLEHPAIARADWRLVPPPPARRPVGGRAAHPVADRIRAAADDRIRIERELRFQERMENGEDDLL